MSDEVSVTCWCERVELMAPLALIKLGQTRSCGHITCHRGCESQMHWDAFEVTVDADRLVPAVRGAYNPAVDSHMTFKVGPHRHDHPNDVLLAGGPLLCYCGCGEPRKNRKGYFLQGHDQRILGILTRAVRHSAGITLIDPDTGVVLETLSPLDYAARFNTGKKDWIATIEQRAIGKLAAGVVELSTTAQITSEVAA